jgi:hypothetical protein
MKAVAAGIGALMVLVGLVWMLQGLGYLGGSSMTGDPKWAIIGAIMMVVSGGLVWFGRRR